MEECRAGMVAAASLADHARAAVDVGATCGLYAGASRNSSEVHCFEPIPWLADDLAARLPRRGVLIHKLTLSNCVGTAELRIPYDAAGHQLHGLSSLETGNPFVGDATTRLINCRLERLDAVVEDTVGFIKIESKAMSWRCCRAQRTLRRDRPTLRSRASGRPTGRACQYRFLNSLDMSDIFTTKTTA